MKTSDDDDMHWGFLFVGDLVNKCVMVMEGGWVGGKKWGKKNAKRTDKKKTNREVREQ
jgi:hypothetical protein